MIIFRNIKTVASILLITMIEVLRTMLIVKNENQQHLAGEIKIKARGPIDYKPPMDLKDTSDEDDAASKSRKPDDSVQIISGLYNKDDLIAYFSKNLYKSFSLIE
jgi:hypothetical protein